MQARAQGREWNRERKEGGNQRKEKGEKHRERWLWSKYRWKITKDSHQGRNDETHASTFPPSFVWQNHTNQVSIEGCKLHMGSGQAKSGSNLFFIFMDLVFLKTS